MAFSALSGGYNSHLLDMLSQRDVMECRLEATELEANVLRDRVRVMGSV